MTHHLKRHIYPFSAIVGQEDMKLALLLNAVNPRIGGVLIRGQKGTGKSTAVRALANLLPEIEVVEGCPFNCDPHNPGKMCDSCFQKYERGEKLPVVKRKVRLVSLPLNATVDRVVGSLDIERALSKGVKAIEPGLLAEANQGTLYIDEVNLLDDYIVDILLDVAASGVNIIEREGVSLTHPASFILIGTMNPEEGELRPQLLDRFGLQVIVEELKDPRLRAEIVRRDDAFQTDPEGFVQKYKDMQQELINRIIETRALLPKVEVSDEILTNIIKLCLKVGASSHRSEITLTRTAKTLAAFNGRTEVSIEDVKTAARFALPHRLRTTPFESPTLDKEYLDSVFDELEQEQTTEQDEPSGEPMPADRQESISGVENTEQDDKKNFKPANVSDIELSKIRMRDIGQKRFSGKRIRMPSSDERGVYFSSRIPTSNHIRDIAIDASIRAAVLRTIRGQTSHRTINSGRSLLIQIQKSDLREKIRHTKSVALIVFLVDASGSMAAMKRMEIAKGTVLSILKDSYVNRDMISLIIFSESRAKILLPPTRNIEYAYNLLRNTPTGGATPLSSGLATAYNLIWKSCMNKRIPVVPYLILITDGKGNIPLSAGGDIDSEIRKFGMLLQLLGTHMLIIDTRPKMEDFLRIPNYMDVILDATQAAYIKCERLSKEKLVKIVHEYRERPFISN
ncbi:MAG: magnesium chelatase subunit D family protein [Promethearchaeota archaeon]